MISTKEITWLAGLLEGEGCFSFSGSIRIELWMADLDVVQHAAGLLGTKVNPRINKRYSNRKPMYGARLYGFHTAGWMMTLYTLMGTRRQAKIREQLNIWQSQRVQPQDAKCHPERKHYAKGLCNNCYARNRNKQRKEGR